MIYLIFISQGTEKHVLERKLKVNRIIKLNMFN